MRITKLCNKVVKEKNRYVINESISDDEIIVELDKPLVVHGDVLAESFIIVNDSLIADNNIQADRIDVGHDLKSGGEILTLDFIEADNVFAEKLINAGCIITDGNITVNGVLDVDGDITAVNINAYDVYVSKNISIKGNIDAKNIKVGEFIEAKDIISRGEIYAGDTINSYGNIKAKLSVIAGNYLEAFGSIEAVGNIKAGIDIRAGNYIKANNGILAGYDIFSGNTINADFLEAGGSIGARNGITVENGILAGDGIQSESYISSGKRIFAGLATHHTSSTCDKTIKCKELRNGEICYGELIISNE